MTNAALYFHPDGYDTGGATLLGRHSAGESFLRGFVRHADIEAVHFFNAFNKPIQPGVDLVRRICPSEKQLVWHQNRSRLNTLGVLNLPVPGLDQEAWSRIPQGETAYAICGITHTTATDTIMRTLANFFIAPLHDFDALICTSRAVRDSVESQLSDIRDYLTAEYGPRRRHAEPQRVTIPLGINVEDFQVTPENRRSWRDRLGIPEDALVALYVGRFNFRAKMNPALMALALEAAAKRTSRKIYWVNSGWAGGTPEQEAAFHEPVRALCPSVEYRHIDGRPADVRFSIWSVADFFISFSDNIQETFGLTPVEAMAAGLPCVVTDWNGYRDTVRHGEDGFRIATYAPAPGDGRDLAYAFHAQTLNYDNYVGAAGQFTAMDYRAAADAIVALAEDEPLRQRLGRNAQTRARELFDWSVIIPQYQALWAEQNARRLAAPPGPAWADNPFRPDPFRLFQGYPTHHLTPEWQAQVPEGAQWSDVEPALASLLATYSNFNRMSADEPRIVFDWLREHGPASVRAVGDIAPPNRRPFIRRALLWMARFGALTLTEP